MDYQSLSIFEMLQPACGYTKFFKDAGKPMIWGVLTTVVLFNIYLLSPNDFILSVCKQYISVSWWNFVSGFVLLLLPVCLIFSDIDFKSKGRWCNGWLNKNTSFALKHCFWTCSFFVGALLAQLIIEAISFQNILTSIALYTVAVIFFIFMAQVLFFLWWFSQALCHYPPVVRVFFNLRLRHRLIVHVLFVSIIYGVNVLYIF